MITRKFPARLDLLHQMLQWIIKNIKPSRFDNSELRKIEVACEETLVNIINHAYQKKSANIIQIKIVLSSEKIELVFLDNGPHFNPMKENIKSDVNVPIEKRPLGGLGLILIRQCMDDVRYERKDSQNIFTLIKNVNY